MAELIRSDARHIPLADESVQCCVTSPPYNLRNSTGNGMKDGRDSFWPNAELRNGYRSYNDQMPHDEYVTWQRECLHEMMRVLRPDGAIFYNHKWRVQGGLLQDRSDIVAGFPVRQIIIWKRAGGINFNPGYFLPTYEVIYLICNRGFVLQKGANSLGDVWTIPQESNNPHPAPFPEELAERCIRSASRCGDTVLDPFVGSGTTLRVAMRLNRRGIGCDLAYQDIAKKRTARVQRVLPLG